MTEIKKRIITSIFLFTLLASMYLYLYILMISLIIISTIVWIEFYGLITKIFSKNNLKNKLLKFIYKSISLIYLSILSFLIIFIFTNNENYKIIIIYSLFISVASDIGGLVVGKTFKGKKLIKISPKKTISGSVGSFIFSILLVPFFGNLFENYLLIEIFLFTLLISFISQVGDIFISYLKRKAKVKDTSDILPGHGGFLDRIDGIIFSIPFGIFLASIYF